MKRLKFLASLLTIVMLLGCNASKEGGKANEDNANKVTISYASWGVGTEKEQNIQRKMIKEFEKKYPNIKVKIVESIPNDKWNDGLAAAASAKAMPDVFNLSDIPTAVANDWVLDVADLAKDDEDYAKVPEVVRDAAAYGDAIYALPAGQQFLGYFVNKDLFNEANLDAPEHGVSINQFVDSVKNMTNISKGQIGTNNPLAILDWYPAAVSDSLGWYTYTEEGYHLDSKEFISGLNLAKSITTNNHAYESLTDEQKGNFNGSHPGEVWASGGLGLVWDGTWAIPAYAENLDFDYDFIGIPGGRTVVANDYIGISKTTKHAKEAFLFTKWMTFGKEGYLKQIDLVAKEGKALNGVPLTTDKEVLDAYFEIQDLPGIRKAYENLDNAIIEPVKPVPGYVQSRWEAPTGVKIKDHPNANMHQLLEASVKGEIKIEDYISEMNKLANQKYKEANEAIGK
ncbi:ABC transporter substrate-binding protein [Fictibacillus phosphorivorans]|uniref:ABC transporter substrate-binding protein n=1 Tax=Fictibacillus phosphorivorans TaxID=1221500 RepID=UPI00204176C1|nr:extracellular solute-binding protein [Fictibacillus phosphorivorans]MCM3718137.1 extracellular solute-binding protein [Fictibacillus phosphorivorans]MCM3775764.1 extracellular solute-binding protein [Fictibacillus phosphorivorans]